MNSQKARFCCLLLVLGLMVPGTRPLAADPIEELSFMGLGGEATSVARTPVLSPPACLETGFRALLRAQGSGSGLDRHRLGRRLTSTTPSPGVGTLILALEGTGAFEPRMAPLLIEAARLWGPPTDQNATYRAASKVIADAEGRDCKWSALMVGPLLTLLAEPDLLPGGFDWASFPSEEVEVLAGKDGFTLSNLRSFESDVGRSLAARPQGMVDALRFALSYLRNAVSADRHPRLVILSHSSGGRSAVKLVEEFKDVVDPRSGKRGVQVDLVFTIDPVREAHEALAELVPQMVGQGTKYNLRKIGLGGLMDKLGVDRPILPRVWSRSQPESLYKPANALRWVSVYQRQDTLGLKLSPHHGIQGSPIRDADFEREIESLGDDGHGAIAYHATTLEILRDELKKLGTAP